MLGRTASNLFWISRFMERAENMARMLDVGYRVSLTPGLDSGHREQWESTLHAAGIAEAFSERYEEAEVARICDFMLFDRENAASVYSCLASARNNARAVRTAITSEMWQSINTTWLEFSGFEPSRDFTRDIPRLVDWIKRNTAQFRGTMLNTLMRTDGYSFSQLGAFIERADNTARILDVKYYVLLPRTELVGSNLDMSQWTTILRAASAHRSYKHAYRDRFKAWNIAEFLILRREMPRSLAHCYGWISSTLDDLEHYYGNRYDCHELCLRVDDTLKHSDMELIFQGGLHEFLTNFIASNNSLAMTISEDYNFY